MLALALHSVRRTRPALDSLAAAPAVWCLLATAVLVAASLGSSVPPLRDWLGDTDDAVRLVTVRELLGGAPWFDTTLPRIGAPEPLLSHWSRLIDAPLAAIVAVLTPLLGADSAELAMRMLWPALLFLLLSYIVVREAQRRAGPWAVGFAAMFMVTSATALAQFRLGRVDHHNAMILCAVTGLLFLVRALEEKRAGWVAGVFIGLSLAIGYEPIALVVPAFAMAALPGVWQPRYAQGVVHAATAATVTLLAALLLTIPPARWLDIRCDALSLNLPVLAACCTAGLWAISAFSIRPAFRLAVLALAGAVGVALFASLEPACLAGPFGQVDPALTPIWLDEVMETKNVLWFGSRHPTMALSYVAFVSAGALAQFLAWRRQRELPMALAAGIVSYAALLGCWQLKLMPYACWLAVLPLACFCARLRGTPSFSTPVARLTAAILLTQATFDAGFAALAWPFQAHANAANTVDDAASPMRPCFRTAQVSRLAALPSGLVLAELDLGPFVVALSPHRVIAAPYHRLGKSIIANEAILNGSPEAALPKMRSLGVNYVVLCARSGNNTATEPSSSLQAQLLANKPVSFLRELDLGPGAAIRAWRVELAR